MEFSRKHYVYKDFVGNALAWHIWRLIASKMNGLNVIPNHFLNIAILKFHFSFRRVLTSTTVKNTLKECIGRMQYFSFILECHFIHFIYLLVVLEAYFSFIFFSYHIFLSCSEILFRQIFQSIPTFWHFSGILLYLEFEGRYVYKNQWRISLLYLWSNK